MIINLKISAERAEQESQWIEIKDRLPRQLHDPCLINCQFRVQAFTNYYLLTLKTEASLNVTCQRCLGEYSYPYSNLTELAVCDTDESAEKMMARYEAVVSTNQLDLQELLTDELHLYAPEFHLDIDACDHDMDVFINEKTE